MKTSLRWIALPPDRSRFAGRKLDFYREKILFRSPRVRATYFANHALLSGRVEPLTGVFVPIFRCPRRPLKIEFRITVSCWFGSTGPGRHGVVAGRRC